MSLRARSPFRMGLKFQSVAASTVSPLKPVTRTAARRPLGKVIVHDVESLVSSTYDDTTVSCRSGFMMTFQVPAILASDMAGAGAMAVVSATGGVSFVLQPARDKRTRGPTVEEIQVASWQVRFRTNRKLTIEVRPSDLTCDLGPRFLFTLR